MADEGDAVVGVEDGGVEEPAGDGRDGVVGGEAVAWGDLQLFGAGKISQATEQAQARRARWVRLPYGIPLCVGFLGYLAYRYLEGTLPVPGA